MGVDPKFVGRSYGPYRYEIALEKMKEYAYAITGGVPNLGIAHPPEGLSPLLHDREAAKKGPHGDVIAFPTFCVTFAMAPFGDALCDKEIDMDLLHLVHGEQELEFHEVMRPGDVMTTTGTISEIFDKAGMDFVTVVSESKNQHGKTVVKGTWTAVIRRV